MPQGQYAGNPQQYPGVVALPDDSDVLDASEIDAGMENLGDRTAFTALRTRGNPGQNWRLSKILSGGAGTTGIVTPANYTLPWVGVSSGDFIPVPGNTSTIYASLSLPPGVTLTALSINGITILNTTSGGSTFKLYAEDFDGNQTLLASANGPGAGQPAGTTFNITLIPGSPTLIDSTHIYYVKMTGDTGVGGANIQMYSPQPVYYTPSTSVPNFLRAVMGPVVWDPCYGQWLAPAIGLVSGGTSPYFVLQSYDGENWSVLNGLSPSKYTAFAPSSSANPQPTGIAVRPSDGLVSLAIYSGGGAFFGAAFNQATQTWSNSGGSFTPTPPLTFVAYFNGKFIAIAGGSITPANSTDGAHYSNAGVSGWSPPGGSFGNIIAICQSVNVPTPTLYVFSSSTQYGFYAYTTDGTTWNFASLPSLLANEQVVGAVWDQTAEALLGGTTGGLYLLTSTTTATRLFSNIGTLVDQFAHGAIGLATNNGELVTLSTFGNSRDSNGNLVPCFRMLQSTDSQDTSVSFQMTQLNIPRPDSTLSACATGAAGSFYTNGFSVTGYGGQFLAFLGMDQAGSGGTAYFAKSQVAGQLPTLPF